MGLSYLCMILWAILPTVGAEIMTWSAPLSGLQNKPPARTGAALGSSIVGSKLVLFGGGDSGMDDTWVVDPNISSSSWKQVSGTKPPKRFSFVSGVDRRPGKNKFIIATGQSGTGGSAKFLNDVWSFDFATELWTVIITTGVHPKGRYGAVGGVANGYLYVTHGFSKGSGGMRYDDTWALELDTGVWQDVSSEYGRPHGRCLGTGTVTSTGEIILYGGCGSGGYGRCASPETWIWRSSHVKKCNGCPIAQGLWSRASDYCNNAALTSTMSMVPGSSPRAAVVFGGNGGGPGAAGVLGWLEVDTGKWLTLKAYCDSSCPDQEKKWPIFAEGTDKIFYYSGVTSDISELRGNSGVGFSSAPDCKTSFDLRIVHGALMFLSWGFLLPTGVSVAHWRKYFDIAPRWFFIHRVCQSTGILLQLTGFIIAMLINDVAKFLATPHAALGVVIFAIGLQNPINAYFRPHIHPNEPKTKKRQYWEYLHKGAGYTAVTLGLLNPFWGLRYLDGALNKGQGVGTIGIATAMYTGWVSFLVAMWIFLFFKQKNEEKNKSKPKPTDQPKKEEGEEVPLDNKEKTEDKPKIDT